MSHKFILIAFVCGVFAFSSARAQENKNEVGFLLGGTVTPGLNIGGPGGGKIDIGKGLTFQATYARRLLTLPGAFIHFEVPFLALPLQDVNSSNGSVVANYASLFVTPGLRVKLVPGAGISPWLSVGGGYARFDSSKELIDGNPNSGTIGANRGAVQLGAGVDLQTPVRILFPIGLRLEARDLYSGKPNYNLNTGGGFQHNLVFSGGFVLHF